MLQSHRSAMAVFHWSRQQIFFTPWLMIRTCKVRTPQSAQRADWSYFARETGKIAAANVLSDMYAMGVTECDNMLMLLAVSTKMTEKERDIVMPLMMRGFKVISFSYDPVFCKSNSPISLQDCALEAGTNVTGGQSVMNPWCTIGGVATSVCQPTDLIMLEISTLLTQFIPINWFCFNCNEIGRTMQLSEMFWFWRNHWAPKLPSIHTNGSIFRTGGIESN